VWSDPHNEPPPSSSSSSSSSIFGEIFEHDNQYLNVSKSNYTEYDI
jgi:hypothetical protein